VYQFDTLPDVISQTCVKEEVGMKSFAVGTSNQLKIQVIAKVSSGHMRAREALVLLGVSERTLRRWLRAYETDGIAFVCHGNRNRVPVNKKSDQLKSQIMKFVEVELYDFNMLHALEKVESRFNLKINRETFRRWCHEKGLVKQAHGKRRSRPRFRRNRFSQAGFMLQLDGSPHRWFNNEESCLIVAIDDATSEVMGGEFFKTETMFGCFKVLSDIFALKGLPCVLYVDRAGMYGGQKRTNFSQLVRALEELNIQIIYANSPQGKGRIERLNRTLQDRLIPEMRIAGVTGFAEANKYFKDVYLPHLHNPKFKVQPESSKQAWRPIPSNISLADVFCIKEKRRVARDHTFSYQGDSYLITSDLKYSIHNHDIELQIDSKFAMKAIFAGKELTYKKITKCPKKMAG
jgi:transposase